MLTRPLGPSGIEASAIGLGTWAIGGSRWGGTEESDAIAAIHTALDGGVTLIDTAPLYGHGRSEEVVGKAIADRRDEVVLATKCGLVWWEDRGEHAYDEGDKSIYVNLRPDSIRHEVEQSLKRLGTEVIDLYQTHAQESTTSIEDTMGTLLALKDEGKIRAIGTSNIEPAQLAAYMDQGPIASTQEQFSMIDREIEATLLPLCREHHVAVLAYSPMAMGLLSGKMGPEREFPPDDHRHDNPRFSVENRQRVADMLDAMRSIAEVKGITMAQLVLAWTFHQDGVTHVLAGARTEAQAQANAAAGAVTLEPDELALMNDTVAKRAPDIV